MALQRLNARSKALGEGLAKLSAQLTNRTELLRDAIDASQAEASGVIDELSVKMRQREQRAQETFDQTLADISRKMLSIAVIFLGIIITAGVLIALSIRLPLQQIMTAMHAITSGDYNRKVQGTGASDEVGEMARAVEVFRENAIAKRKTEDELRASKEKAENALHELNAAQQNLIDAERLAALGGLVAGLAARGIRQDLARCRPAAGRQSAAGRRTHSILQAGRGRPLACRAADLQSERGDRPDHREPAACAKKGVDCAVG
jgi:HAMP domain-containing protein